MKEKHTRIGNMAITAAIRAATSGLSYLLHRVSNSDFHVPMLFVLAVLFISLLTAGYVYGIIDVYQRQQCFSGTQRNDFYFL